MHSVLMSYLFPFPPFLPTSVHINEPITEWIQPKTVPYNNWLSNYLIKQQSKLTWTEQMVLSHKRSLHMDKLHWGEKQTVWLSYLSLASVNDSNSMQRVKNYQSQNLSSLIQATCCGLTIILQKKKKNSHGIFSNIADGHGKKGKTFDPK